MNLVMTLQKNVKTLITILLVLNTVYILRNHECQLADEKKLYLVGYVLLISLYISFLIGRVKRHEKGKFFRCFT